MLTDAKPESATNVTPETGVPWDAIARMALHPVQIRLLEEFDRAEQPLTPSDLQLRIGTYPLSLIAYHVRRLREMGLLRLTHTEPSRGSLLHYYVLARDIGRHDCA